jgi:hypothetical protein
MQIFAISQKKNPDEIKGYGVDFAGEVDDGDSISSVEITVTDQDDDTDQTDEMFVTGSDAINGTVISALFQAGEDGHRYFLNYLATTALGEKPLGRLILRVSEK